MNTTEVQALKQKIDRYEQLVNRGNELSAMLDRINELTGPFMNGEQIVSGIDIDFVGTMVSVRFSRVGINAHALGRFLTVQLNEQLCAVTKEMAEL